jgi:hypothetical protein
LAKKKDFQKLLDEALKNAQEDRLIAKEAYNGMRGIWDVDTTQPETMQAVMVAGASAVKLIEAMTRSNEQVVRLAALQQKEDPDEEEEEEAPASIEEMRAALSKQKAG